VAGVAGVAGVAACPGLPGVAGMAGVARVPGVAAPSWREARDPSEPVAPVAGRAVSDRDAADDGRAVADGEGVAVDSVSAELSVLTALTGTRAVETPLTPAGRSCAATDPAMRATTAAPSSTPAPRWPPTLVSER
jgi:hypothetical protein